MVWLLPGRSQWADVRSFVRVAWIGCSAVATIGPVLLRFAPDLPSDKLAKTVLDYTVMLRFAPDLPSDKLP